MAETDKPQRDYSNVGRGIYSEAYREAFERRTGITVDEAKDLLTYLFEPPRTAEEWRAYQDWAFSDASWSELPKGALAVELTAGIHAGVGGLQGLRDIWKDVKNKETGWHNLLDALAVVPLVGMVAKVGANAGDIKRAGRAAIAAKGAKMAAKLGGKSDDYVYAYRLVKEADSPLDPSNPLARTGFAGVEEARRVQNPGSYVDRLSYYVAGREPEQALLPHTRYQVDVKIPRAQLYDMYEDPLGIIKRWQDDVLAGSGTSFNEVEREVAKRGLVLYDSRSGRIDMYHAPQEVRRFARDIDSRHVTDLDRAVAERHNASVRAANTLEGNYDVGSTTDLLGNESKAPFIVSPEKWGSHNLPTMPHNPKMARSVALEWDAPDGLITPHEVAMFRQAWHPELTRGGNRMIGTWYDPDTGNVVFDIVEGYDNEKIAQRMARHAEQKGYYSQAEGFKSVPQSFPNEMSEARNRTWLADNVDYLRERRRAALMDSFSEADQAWYLSRPLKEQREVERIWSLMPTPELQATWIALGGHKLGWFKDSGRTLVGIFGADAPRAAAALSSTSPNTKIDKNLAGFLDLWGDWHAAGRPSDPETIAAMYDPIARRYGLMTSNENNVVRVLSETDPAVFMDPDILREGGLLSGLKVDPFYANLMGETQRVTIDTHMTAMGPMDPRSLTKGRRAGMSASIRAGGKAAAPYFGRVLEGSEAQETQWSVIKTLKELSGSQGAEEWLFPGGEFSYERLGQLREAIAETPSFATLMNEPENLERLARFTHGRTPHVAELGAEAPRAYQDIIVPDPEHLRALAQRIDTQSLAGREGFSSRYLFELAPWLFGGGLLGETIRRGGLLGDRE